MSNEPFEQMALRIANEYSCAGAKLTSITGEKFMLDFATRLRAEWLKKCTVGFEDAKYEWEDHDDWQYADRDAERKFFLQAGAASQQQRIAELEKDAARLEFLIGPGSDFVERHPSICILSFSWTQDDGAIKAIDAAMKEQAK